MADQKWRDVHEAVEAGLLWDLLKDKGYCVNVHLNIQRMWLLGGECISTGICHTISWWALPST